MIPCSVRHANCVTIVQAVTAKPADSVETMQICAMAAVITVPNVPSFARNVEKTAANATACSAPLATPVIAAPHCVWNAVTVIIA